MEFRSMVHLAYACNLYGTFSIDLPVGVVLLHTINGRVNINGSKLPHPQTVVFHNFENLTFSNSQKIPDR